MSVALCTYDGEPYLRDQLSSIAQQTYLPTELVVCDDGSRDRTIEIIDSFAREASFPVRLYRNEVNLGSTRNFEKAIGICDSEVIVLADQDDVWRIDKLEKIAGAFSSSPDVVGVFSNARLVDEHGKNLGRTLWQRFGVTPSVQRKLALGGEVALRMLLRKNYVTGATFAFRAGRKKQLTPIPACWVHDGWIALFLTPHGRIIGVNETLIDYRQHPQSQIGTRKSSIRQRVFDYARLESVSSQLQLALDRAESHGLPEDMRRHIRQQLNHVAKRLLARGGGVRSMRRLLPELISGRYHRYSNGLFSFIKDISA